MEFAPLTGGGYAVSDGIGNTLDVAVGKRRTRRQTEACAKEAFGGAVAVPGGVGKYGLQMEGFP